MESLVDQMVRYNPTSLHLAFPFWIQQSHHQGLLTQDCMLCSFIHFHFVLSLGAVIAIFSGIIFNHEKILASNNLLPSSSSTLSLYHLQLTFIGILLSFSPMHFLGFNLLTRRIPDYPDSFDSWNFLSSIGSGITFLSFAIFSY